MKEIFNLKSYFTFLSRNKLYTFINVFGLSVSLMFVILIGVYIWQEKGIDRQHRDAHRIYTLGIDFKEDGERALGFHHAALKQFRKQYPEVENTCGFVVSTVRLKKNDNYCNVSVMLSDSSLFSVFDFPLIEGNRTTCLKEKNNAVITEHFANRWFGTEDVLGKEIVWNDSIRFRVSGVVKNFSNTIVNKDVEVIIDFSWNKYLNLADTDEMFPTMINTTGCSAFLKVREGTKMMGREKEFKDFLSTFWPSFGNESDGLSPILVPLDELHFSKLEPFNENLNLGDEHTVSLLFTVGLVILLFAIMNYINLTVAQAGYRSREIATRRLFGASRKGVAVRLIVESTLLCLLSLAVAILLSLFSAPAAERLIGCDMEMELLCNPVFVGIAVIGTVVIGCLSGIIPASVMSKAKPIEVVRGTFRHRTKMFLSKIFIIVQNVITIVLLASALIMSLQMRHLTQAPLGFETQNLICLTQYHAFSGKDYRLFVERLRKLPAVSMVSASRGTPQDGGNNYTIVEKDKSYPFQIITTDADFMKIYGLSLKNDLHVNHCPKVFANAAALQALRMNPSDRHLSRYYKEYGFTDSAGREAFGGTLSDLHLVNILSDSHKPLLVRIEDRMDSPWSLTIQVKGDPAEAYGEIQKLFAEVFHEELDESHPFVDKYIEQQFEKELRTAHVVSLFSLIAILISLLGLIAISTYFIQQRNKEIAIRKIFGSTGNQIRRKLINTFLAYVGISFAIGVPIVWYFMSDWISKYDYRIVWWPCIIAAGAIVLLICFLAVAVQSHAASNANPVERIKDNQ